MDAFDEAFSESISGCFVALLALVAGIAAIALIASHIVWK
jgi:hypothetical protein